MELPSDDGNSQMELPGKRSKPGPKLQAQAAVKGKDFEILENNKAKPSKGGERGVRGAQTNAAPLPENIFTSES